MRELDIPRPLFHAYLLTGGDQEGRLAAARTLTAAYLCEQGEGRPCGRCRCCRKVERDVHPDVFVLSPASGKAEVSMEQVRRLRADVYIRPNEGRRKVYVVERADGLRPEAQSVLLKVLEDGPAYGAFLLCVSRPGLLLPTIRSRCECLSLPPVAERLPEQALEQGRRLARLLIGEDEWALARCAVELERTVKGGEQLEQLLAATEEELSTLLTSHPREAVRALRAVKESRAGLVYHPGVGHVLGRLCIEATEPW